MLITWWNFCRVIWVMLVIAALVSFGALVGIKLRALHSNQKTVNVEVNYNASLTFPAVTFCNLNKYRYVNITNYKCVHDSTHMVECSSRYEYSYSIRFNIESHFTRIMKTMACLFFVSPYLLFSFSLSLDFRHFSCNSLCHTIITSLAKEVMFLVALVSLSVCLSVCLSVDNITQKVINGLGWNFMEGSRVVQGRTD